jgi:hypothetical protein
MILTELGILIGFQLFYDYKIITSLIAYSCLSGLLAHRAHLTTLTLHPSFRAARP